MEIHNYPLTSGIFQDEDYYDIDFWDGASFVTKKILGSTIKAGILASVISDNIYNTDGTLLTDRIVSTNGNTLVFENALGGVGIRLLGVNETQIQFARGNEFVAWSIGKNIDGNEDFLLRRHTPLGAYLDIPFQVNITTGAITFNEAYTFPTTAGLPDEVLMLNGSNELVWVGLADVNIYNSNGALAGARLVDLAGFLLAFSDIGGVTELRGNILNVVANATYEAILNLTAGNNQKRALRWTDQGDLRWEMTTEVAEIGGDTGTDLVLYSYDDGGILIGEVLRVNRSTRAITFNSAYEFPITDGTAGQVLGTDGAGNVDWVSVVSSQSLNDVLLVGNETLGEDILITLGDFVDFGTISNPIQKFGNNIGGVGIFGVQVGQNFVVWIAGNNYTSINGGAITMVSDAPALKFVDNQDGFTGELNRLPLTAGRTWSLPNKNGTIAMLSDLVAEKRIGQDYAYNLSGAGGFTWNGIPTVGTTALVTLLERWRLQAFAGTGQPDGCFTNFLLPSTYISGSSIKVSVASAENGVGGNIKYWVGLGKPTVGNAFGGNANTEWQSIIHVAQAGYVIDNLTLTFLGTNLVAGEPISVMIFRDPSDVQDTYTGDSYVNSISVEQV